MAGGGGTRLWPVSRNAHPKQFQQLTSGASLLQETARRVVPLAGMEGLYVTTVSSYVQSVRDDLPELPADHIFVEPAKRDNAAAIGLAIIRLLHETEGEDDTFLMLPSDHSIVDTEALRQLLRAADTTLQAHPQAIVSIGVRPTAPETAYGYIKMDDATRTVVNEHEMFRVERFVEKPDAARAAMFLQDWTYLWNTGIYAFRLHGMWELFARFLPDLTAGLTKIRSALGTQNESSVIDEIYPTLHATSIDYGITEKAEEVYVFPAATLGWSDVGSWQLLRDILPKDDDGNVIRGQHVGVSTHNSLVFGSSDRLVATLGLENIIVVDTPDALLVADVKEAPRLKELLEKLKDSRERLL